MRDYNTMYQESLVNPGGKDYKTIAAEAIRDQGYWGAPTPTVAAAPVAAPVVAPVAEEPKVETPAPTLELPTLNLGADASVLNQRDKILRYDSLPMQQARTQASEEGTPSGQIASSQQEGAAMRAMSSEATSLGEKEATIAAGEQISNWKNKATEAMTIYTNQYSERLSKMDIGSNEKQLMASLNTSLAQSMLSSNTILLNNTDLEVDQGVTDRLLAIVNAAQDNNNLALEMDFRY